MTFFPFSFTVYSDKATPLGKYSWDKGGQKDGVLLRTIHEVNKLGRKDLEVHPMYP